MNDPIFVYLPTIYIGVGCMFISFLTDFLFIDSDETDEH